MTSIFLALISVIKAIPIVDKWFQQIMVLYMNSQIKQMRSDFISAMQIAIEQHNQIELELALGNKNAGKASNIPGAIVVDSIPGMSNKS